MHAEELADFAWLFRAHAASIARTVNLVVLDRAKADDLTEDAFARLWRHWDSRATYDAPDAWVRRVALRRAVRGARHEQQHPASDCTRDQPAGPPSPDADLTSALTALTPTQRAVVALHHLHGLATADVAAIVRMPGPTIAQDLHAARTRLAAALPDEETEVPLDVRLGRALARHADAFRPDVERRLAAIVGRQRRRDRSTLATTVAAAAVLVVALLGVGTGGHEQRDSPADELGTAPAAVAALGGTIPDGRYTTLVLRRTELRRGFSRAEVRKQLGPDGELPVRVELFAPFYIVYATDDAGRLRREDIGTAVYDRSGRLVLTSSWNACPGCSVTYRWTLRDRTLVLSIADGADDPRPGRDVQIVTEHAFQRIG